MEIESYIHDFFFPQVMHMFSCSDAKQVTQAFDLSQFSSVCDLGGGTGAIGAHIASTYPQMDVTVFDLPHVISTSEHFIQDKPNNLKFEAGEQWVIIGWFCLLLAWIKD